MGNFTDIRDLLKTMGVNIVDESISGDPGSSNFTMVDPEGNAILIDQHV